MAQRVGRVIALLFHDHGTRRGVSGQQHAPAALYHRKEQVPIVQEAGWSYTSSNITKPLYDSKNTVAYQFGTVLATVTETILGSRYHFGYVIRLQ